MKDLAYQRCANHEFREAVARCPECGRFFCRECITEHEDLVVCASCLRKLVRESSPARRRFDLVMGVGEYLLGVLIVWLFFYIIGRILISVPASFHEGTLWATSWWEI